MTPTHLHIPMATPICIFQILATPLSAHWHTRVLFFLRCLPPPSSLCFNSSCTKSPLCCAACTLLFFHQKEVCYVLGFNTQIPDQTIFSFLRHPNNNSTTMTIAVSCFDFHFNAFSAKLDYFDIFVGVLSKWTSLSHF